MKNEVETQKNRQSGIRIVYKNSKGELVLEERRSVGIWEKVWHYFTAVIALASGIGIPIMLYDMVIVPGRPLADVETEAWIITGIAALPALFFIYAGITGLFKKAPRQHIAETVITEDVMEIIHESPDEFSDIIDAIQKFEK